MFDFQFDTNTFDLNKKKEELKPKDILPFLVKILDKRFNDKSKKNIRLYNNRISFSCPYCGDSKDRNKTRGNVYFENNGYKCFNCGIVKTLDTLFKDFLENGDYDEISKYDLQTKFINHTNNLQTIFNIDDGLNHLFTKEQIFNHYNLVDYTQNKFLLKYLNGRLIPENKYNLFGYNEKQNEIYVLNSYNNYVISFTKRTFKNPHKKYLMYKLNKIYSDFKREYDTEKLDLLDSLSTIFNLFNIDFSQKITIFEGFFDSLFMDNSIALNGAIKNLPFDFNDFNVRFCLDNDETGQKNQLELLDKNVDVFLWKKILEDVDNQITGIIPKVKDFNDLNKLLIKNNLYTIRNNIENYFSNNKYDKWWI